MCQIETDASNLGPTFNNMAAEQAKNTLEIVKKYETFLDSILKRLARRRGIYYTLRAAFVGSEGDYKEAEMREVL